VIYIAIGIFLVPLVGDGARLWVKVAAVVSLVLGLFFSLVAVNLIPYSRERRLVKTLAAHLESNPVSDDKPEEIIKAFKSIGDFSSYLTDGDTSLSRHGARVVRRARRVVRRRPGARKATAEVSQADSAVDKSATGEL
jgi:hypothetical protein